MDCFDEDLSVSVIIPVHKSGRYFRKCLDSIKLSNIRPKEILVLVDGAIDESYVIASAFATRVLEVPVPIGPARGRNMAASCATGAILLFIDADVMIPPNAVGLVVEAFKGNHKLSAVFGTYDDLPSEPNFLSQFKNLFHHYIHQTSNEEACTFWTGCGAIRRDVFLEMEGFNEKYRYPCIEDVELGYRLKNSGFRISLLKSLQVTHLKRWDAFSLIRTDIFCRAVPWSQLILREGSLPHDLNFKTKSRVCVTLIGILVLFLTVSFHFVWLLIPSILLASVLVWLNRDLYCFFLEKRGFFFMLQSIPWHWLYYLYSGGALTAVFSVHKARSALSRLFPDKFYKCWPKRARRIFFNYYQMTGKKVAIIGAGPAGLSAAHKLVREGIRPIVFEKASLIGGIARTEMFRGYYFDVGGHRFFTKIREVENLWHSMLGNDFLKVPRTSYIYYKGRFFNYLLDFVNTFNGLGFYESLKSLASYCRAKLHPYKKESTVEAWIINRFGRRLYEAFSKIIPRRYGAYPAIGCLLIG